MRGRIRLIILIIVLISSLIFTLNKINLPIVYQKYDSNFSALNVVEDIKFVSKEPHSVKHPLERARVRDYLFDRLNSLGMKTEYLRYDSVKDRFGEYNDISNLYAVAEPSKEIESSSYILLIAHLDSRFKMQKKGKWVTSYGAADDGYGLGVILELIRVCNYYKGNWNQGVKVLFTDSEESNLEGIKNTLHKDKRVLDRVGFIINLEARGIKGPAVMFETSPGNSKIIELYSKGNSLYSYSFTTAIYNILPNYTDFTLIKGDYPGINFAVIDNLDYYHTDLDNFNNISLQSIQHYGNQISPIIREYLTEEKYSNPDFLVNKTNNYYLSIPLIGFIVFSQPLYTALILISVLLSILILLKGVYHEKRFREILKSFFIIFSSIFTVAGVNLLISYLLATLNGMEYNLTYLPFVKGDKIIFITMLILCVVIIFIIYKISKNRMKLNSTDIHLSSIIFISILTIISHFIIGDSTLFSFIMLLSVLSFILNYNKILINFTLFPLFMILVFSIPVIYLLNVALTIGSLSVILSYCAVILWQIIPITDGYLRREI